MFGQMNHFGRFAPEKIPYGITRYTNESKRILGVMDKRLSENAHLAGAVYSIADIACYGWVRSAETHLQSLDAWPNVKRWADVLGARPPVQKGMLVPKLN